jgi:hydroxymethylbilane synthase
MRRLYGLLLDHDIDVVIHRGFDLRGEVPEGLRIAAVLARDTPYDALLGPRDLSFDELADDATVGVVHLRARAQLLDHRPELQYELITGDAGAWLTALIDGRIEALVAPAAAIEHLALQERVCELFPPELLVPAPGSGVLLCLCREDDALTASRLRRLHHPPTAIEYTAECTCVESMGGRWEAPIGVLARLSTGHLDLVAMVATADGTRLLREQHRCPDEDPCRAGAELASLLLEAGADGLFEGDTNDDPCPPIAGRLPGGALDVEWEEDEGPD